MEQYIAYLRVSTKEQGRSGFGLEAQRRDISLFVNQRPCEATIIQEYVDVVNWHRYGSIPLAA